MAVADGALPDAHRRILLTLGARAVAVAVRALDDDRVAVADAKQVFAAVRGMLRAVLRTGAADGGRRRWALASARCDIHDRAAVTLAHTRSRIASSSAVSTTSSLVAAPTLLAML